MKKTLYDLLEVSPHASHDTIEISYRRLAELLDPDIEANRYNPDARTSFNLLKEAYVTLSNPARRQAYDNRLQDSIRFERVEYVEPFWNKTKLLAATLLIVVGGVLYSKHLSDQERTRVLREQAIAEQKRAEAMAQAKIAEERLESVRLAKEAWEQAETRRSLDAARRRAEDVSRELARAERELKLEARRDAEIQERAQERKRREVENQLRRDQADRERKLRELDNKLSNRR